MEPFARTINAARRYAVSSTLGRVDWNAGLVPGDLEKGVQQLRMLPLALAEAGLIEEYEFVVHPRLAGPGPALFAGLLRYVDLRLTDRIELNSGSVSMRHEPRS